MEIVEARTLGDAWLEVARRNLVELAALQAQVADEHDSRPGSLVLHVETAHVYEPELELVRGLTAVSPGA